MKILEVRTEKRKIGNRGERAAAWYLRLHGYRILKRNYVTDAGEIDLVARRKSTVAFVEVKTRMLEHISPKEARPAAAVTPDKQRKILAAAQFFFPAREEGIRYRFDIIEVIYSEKSKLKPKQITHMKGAFNRNSAQRRTR